MSNRIQYFKATFSQAQLRTMARAFGLKTTGNKGALAARLAEAEHRAG